MNQKRGRRRWLVASATGVVVVAAVVTIMILSGASSSPPAPSSSDMQAIQATIDQFHTLKTAASAAEAESDPLSSTVPATAISAADAPYQEGLGAIGAASFAAEPGVGDYVQLIADLRRNGEIVLKEEFKVLSLDYKWSCDNGDVVVWATIWNGVVERVWPGKIGVGTLPAITYIDATPTYQYRMRNVGGVWKIMAEDLVFHSEDGSTTQYGPDTPHFVDSNPLVTIPVGAASSVSSSPAPEPSAAATEAN